MGVFSSFISSITNAVNTLRATTEEKRKEVSLLRQFFRERDLSTNLYTRVNDFFMSSGAFKTKLQEKAVKSLLELPESLKSKLHTEMYLSLLQTAAWVTADALALDPIFFRLMCHRVMVEHIANPSSEVFMPDTECYETIILTGGDWTYEDAYTAERVELPLKTWLCEVALWGHWEHRGHLYAQVTSEYCTIDGHKFASLALSRGGPLHAYLKTVGVLLAGEIEALDESGGEVSDLSVNQELWADLAERAQRFLQMVNNGRSDTAAFAA
jgi:hypothetical protein